MKTIQITPDEDRAALAELLTAWRAELARVRRTLMLHRDVLNSPADAVAGFEAQAIKAAQAIEAIESWRDGAG